MRTPVGIAAAQYDGMNSRTRAIAVCDDGSCWVLEGEERDPSVPFTWKQLPAIPGTPATNTVTERSMGFPTIQR